MKIENFKRVQEIIKALDKDQKLLDQLLSFNENDKLRVLITYDSKPIATIGIGNSYEHPFSKLATKFIEACAVEVSKRKSEFNKELQTL